MRMKPARSRHRRTEQGLAYVLIAALSCAWFAAPSALEERTNASLWACITLASMALVYSRPSK